jgi:hypothetical protein
MASIDITDDFWMAYVEDVDEYGGGKSGGTLASPTQPTVSGDLTKFDRITSVDIVPAGREQEMQQDLNAGMHISDILRKYTSPGEITIEMYLQTDDMYDIAISAWGSSGDGLGSIPTSLLIHFDNGVTETDLIGCVITSWSATIDSQGVVKQTISFRYSKIMSGNTIDISSWSGNPWQTGAIAIVSNVKPTIDSKAYSSIYVDNITQTIEIEYWEGADAFALGYAYMVLPVVKNLTCTVEMIYKDRDSNTWGAFNSASGDEVNETIQQLDGSIIWHSTLTSTLTSIVVESTDSGVRDENGLIKHSVTFVKGGEYGDFFDIS